MRVDVLFEPYSGMNLLKLKVGHVWLVIMS